MLLSLALIFLCGMSLAALFRRLSLPSLLGMLITGILLGPYVLDLIAPNLLAISADLRKIALIVILMRAGLNLDINDLKKVGRPAVLMCFVPACFEIAGMVLIAPKLLSIPVLEAAVAGAVVAAVSPAVIVPKMLFLIENNYGTKKGIPQLIMAGASVDDVFVIVLFTAFTGLLQGGSVSVSSFASIPVSIVLGLALGILSGMLLSRFFARFHMRDTTKVILLLSISFLFVTGEDALKQFVPFSGLLAVMSMGIALKVKKKTVSDRLSLKFSKLWVGAEVLLFVLVGAAVDIQYAASAGWNAVLLILLVLIFRMAGVFLCMLGTPFTAKEKVFCMIAYTPKATVQAAIGSIPLSMGLACGQLVLTVAVLSILITAPLGALGIDLTYRKFLDRTQAL